MVIPLTFLPFIHNRVWWHAETNYGHSAPFCHLEAASPMTCRDKLWSFRSPFRHSDTIVSDGTQRQIMVILRPFVIQRRWARWHGETNYGHSVHLFAIQRQSCLMARRDKLWSFCALLSSRGGKPDDMWRQIMVIPHLLPSRYDRVWWHVETNYGHSAPCVNQEERIRQYQQDVGCSVLIIFKIFAGTAGKEIDRPNGVPLERN